MSKKDTKAKEYMADNRRFADLCNVALFDGERVVLPSDLEERDSTEVLSILGVDSRDVEYQQKWRDLLKSAVIKATGEAVYVLIGLENQSDIHYAMPVKSMIYDAMNYGTQVKEAARRHRQNKDFGLDAEFLSGFAATDKLTPIVPITLYLGADEWNAPVSLHEMFGEVDEKLLSYVPDYRIVLVAPNELDASDLDKFETDLREVLGAIKYSKDKDKMDAFINGSSNFFCLANETLEAINTFIDAKIEVNVKGGETNVCKAFDDMKKEIELTTNMKNLRSLFANGGSFELAVKMFGDLSEDVIRQVQEEVATGMPA